MCNLNLMMSFKMRSVLECSSSRRATARRVSCSDLFFFSLSRSGGYWMFEVYKTKAKEVGTE